MSQDEFPSSHEVEETRVQHPQEESFLKKLGALKKDHPMLAQRDQEEKRWQISIERRFIVFALLVPLVSFPIFALLIFLFKGNDSLVREIEPVVFGWIGFMIRDCFGKGESKQQKE